MKYSSLVLLAFGSFMIGFGASGLLMDSKINQRLSLINEHVADYVVMNKNQ